MTRFCSSMVLVLCTLSGFGQAFTPGFIRMKDSTELQGLIGQIIPGKTERVQYKASESGEVTEYFATEVAGFGVGDTFFSSFRNLNRRDEWIFIEIIVEGNLSLYRRNRLFFVTEKGTDQFVHIEGKTAQDLSKMMRGCPLVASKGLRIKLTKDNLAIYIKEYNECVAGANPYVGALRPFSIAVLAGYDYSSTTFKNLNHSWLMNMRFHDESFVQVGADVSLRSYSRFSTLGLYAGLHLNKNRYEAVTSEIVGTRTNTYQQVNEYSIVFSELKIPLGLEISPLTRARLSYLFRGGVTFVPTLKFDGNHIRREINAESLEPTQISVFKRDPQWSVSFGLDYKLSTWNRIRLQGTFSQGRMKTTVTDETEVIQVEGTFTSVNVMVGYVF